MKNAIVVIGAPAVGKTELLKSYENHVVQVGKYASSLSEWNPLKKECMKFWNKSETFNPELLERLLNNIELPQREWVLLDGTPRNRAQEEVVKKYFSIKAVIEVYLDKNCWFSRARKAVLSRKDREDSSLDQLIKRKEKYEEEMNEFKNGHDWYIVDNSGNLSQTKLDFRKAIKTIVSYDSIGVKK